MPRLINAFEQFFDGSGNPLISGQLEFYESGSSTMLKTTFANLDETVANPNPVILSADGRAPNIFGTGSYRVVLKNSAGTQILIRDPVGGDDALVFGAEWSAVISYSEDEVVYDGGEYWISLVNNNIANNPSTDSGANWQVIDFTPPPNITVFKPEDTPLTTDGNTLDPHLKIQLELNSFYKVSGYLNFDQGSGAAGFGVVPINVTLGFITPTAVNMSESANDNIVQLGEGSRFNVSWSGVVFQAVSFTGLIKTTTSGDTLWNLIWSQGTPDAQPTTLHEGSWINAEKIG